MIKPTIGRVVWFYPAGHPEGEQPHAALIAYVWDDTRVNLAAHDANGNAYGVTSVLLIQDDGAVPSGGFYATWMPYQVGQAKAQELGAPAPVT